MFPFFHPTTGRAAYMYSIYEFTRASAFPFRTWARSIDQTFNHPESPFGGLPMNRAARAGWRVIDDLTKRYTKPAFEIETCRSNGVDVAVEEVVVFRTAFCRLLHFRKATQPKSRRRQPRVLIIAPLSGHFATLVRGTVRAMLAEHDVYVTDWNDSRMVPAIAGRFDFHDFIDDLVLFYRHLGPDLHVMAVCQPSVAALAATALLAEDEDPCQPRSLTLMAGPVDASRNPTKVNQYSLAHTVSWFRQNVITMVPPPNPGVMRAVYPGFLQLAGFMGMNMDNHLSAYQAYFQDLIRGDADSAEQHRKFYDEYLAVMDLPAEFFLQTVELVFHQRALATRSLHHHGRLIDCGAIRGTVLMTVEGERDDICGLGQTEAAHDLCTALSPEQRYHYVQSDVGHYGVFNGTRWRTEIQPRIAQMIRSNS